MFRNCFTHTKKYQSGQDWSQKITKKAKHKHNSKKLFNRRITTSTVKVNKKIKSNIYKKTVLKEMAIYYGHKQNLNIKPTYFKLI